jgi:hypothetical protein
LIDGSNVRAFFIEHLVRVLKFEEVDLLIDKIIISGKKLRRLNVGIKNRVRICHRAHGAVLFS